MLTDFVAPAPEWRNVYRNVVVVFLAPAGRPLLLAYVAPDGASIDYYIVTINISPLRGWRHKIR
jgi:hypothetical protein